MADPSGRAARLRTLDESLTEVLELDFRELTHDEWKVLETARRIVRDKKAADRG